MAIDNIAFSSGYITVTREGGNQTRYAIADVLRALDIPTGLTYSQVGAITTLANLVVVLIRTLIERDVLDDAFLEGDYNLESIVESIEEMGGDYGEPDISVS
ncbi:hypothetical protein LCGC14_1863280 [marine sediment metagenome]|uniref:Uncharacterized protein n=1 Tax=marine sediment metagenome TaxID=412755 RepID=A0A0F9G6W3_9ZZZZ